jgi:hypothetical protein
MARTGQGANIEIVTAVLFISARSVVCSVTNHHLLIRLSPSPILLNKGWQTEIYCSSILGFQHHHLPVYYFSDLTIKKRRGGKRMRRLKERFEETAMMKQANTRAFSEQAGEYGDDAMGLTRGLLDTSGVAKNAEKRKMKQFDNKASRKRAAQMNAGTTKSGLESSVVFTPVQGMELVNPDANKDRVREANRKWFSDSAGFQSALPKK